MAATNYERYWRHLSLAKDNRSLRREGTTILLWRRYWKDYMYQESFELHRYYKVMQHVLRPNSYIYDTIDTGDTQHFSTSVEGGELAVREAELRLNQKEADFVAASGYFFVRGVKVYNLGLAMQKQWLESVEGEKKWFYFKRDDKEFVNDIRTEGEEWAAKIHP